MSLIEYGTSVIGGEESIVTGFVSPPGASTAPEAPALGSAGSLSGRSAAMRAVLSQVYRVAPTNATVLLTGESGTGKEVAAQAIHFNSSRADRPFVPVNCGAISPQLIESELFGHEKGSFTGAMRSHRGVFEQADGGTLFLDEVTEMPVELQVKLLRVLESRRFVRVGGDQERETDVRIIAASNRCLEEEVASGKLRSDLLYRLQVFPIEIPALRARREDISDLARYFLDEFNAADGEHKRFTEDALAALEDHRWPGNIRELRNVVQRAYIMADRVITRAELPPDVTHPADRVRRHSQIITVEVGASVAEVERNLIFATLEQCGGRKEKAANILGVSLKTLYNRLRQYEQADGIQPGSCNAEEA